MILDDIDFTNFFSNTRGIFCKHFTMGELNDLMEFIGILADANFRCYRANMIVIANRKEHDDDDLIADMEWVARSVGEYRVSSKASINQYISRVKSYRAPYEPSSLVSDDIVYSIGEMMDRLSIETIKREDFKQNNRPQHMIDASNKLSDRVEKYLRAKLEEVEEKNFYECVNEQRTYDLEGIVKELTI